MKRQTLKFVIVGHVDHGKSTLIGRLLFDTGTLGEEKIEEIRKLCADLGKDLEFSYVMDHLEEERDQGITIDTTQIFFSSDKKDYIIIDAPGHVEFVKNMITGASQAEAAILIVDAEEGIQEQTRRHAVILSILGLKQVIVAVNKMDLVQYQEERFRQIQEEVSKFLGTISISPSFVIPVSAKNGDCIISKSPLMPWYDGVTILSALESLSISSDNSEKPLRFVVQDIYNFKKRIIVGRVETGILRAGDPITVLPTGEKTRVKSIEEFMNNPLSAMAGRATGLTTTDKLFIDRGFILVHPEHLPRVSTTIRATIFWMDRTPLDGNEVLTFRCATQGVACSIEHIHKVWDSSTLETLGENAKGLKNREFADVTIKASKPVVVDNFNDIQVLGRFVLERKDICAGGIITELHR